MEFEEGMQDQEQTMTIPAAGSQKKRSLFRNEKKIYLSNVSYQKMDLIEVSSFSFPSLFIDYLCANPSLLDDF